MKLFNSRIIFACLALIVAHIIWGSNFLVAKITLQEIPIMSLAFLRFALAFLLILPFWVTERKNSPVKLADLPWIILIGVCMTTFNIALFYEGLVKTTVTSASVLTLVIPAFSVLFGWIILREKIYVINIVGIVFGLIGTLIILGLPLFLLGISNNQEVLGNLLIVLSSLAWAIGIVFSRKLSTQYSSLTITMYTFAIGALTFAVPALREYVGNPVWVHQVSVLGVSGLFFITLLSSIVAYLFLEWGNSKLAISQSSAFQYIEPLVATTLGVTILGERISYSFIVGAIIIGLGVYWGTLGKEAHHRSIRAHRR